MKKVENEKSPAKAMVTSLQYLTLALSAVAVIMLLGLLFIYHQAPPQPTTTPTPTPQPSPSVCAYAAPAHTAAEAKAYLSRVMAAYTEMMRSQVPDPTYDGCDKTWSAVIRIPATGGERRTYIRINDTPALMLDNTYLEIVKPSYVTEDRVLTNGTILLANKINCSNGSLVRMMEFSDPYCPSCILGDQLIDPFRRQFNSSLDFDYHVLPSTMQAMENNYGREDVNRIAYYIICAQKQQLLDDFKPCAVRKYQSKGVAAPLTKDELDACLPSSLNRTEFDACLLNAPRDLAFDKSMAETYGVSETPMVLFDCQYRVLPEFIKTGFCYTHPTAAGCIQ